MNNLIEQVYDLIKDYREGDFLGEMTKGRIERWIDQFDENDREFILSEMKIVFERQYLSKHKAELFIEEKLMKCVKAFSYSSIQDFLNDSIFLELQPPAKSQSILIDILRNLISEKFEYDYNNCGSNSQKFYLYLDDILCTGNTLYYNIKDWLSDKNSNGETYLSLLESEKSTLILLYYFFHEKNYFKKSKQFEHELGKALPHKKGYKININSNNMLIPSQIDDDILIYKGSIEEEVKQYCTEHNYRLGNSEYVYQCSATNLFSSINNRERLQKIFLKKGIEILGKTNVNNHNMRALGFSLPTHRNFGFGTLCFTWRNIANNTPLVFWYAGGNFFPLFEKQ